MKRLLHTPLALLLRRIALLYVVLMLCRAAFYAVNAPLVGPLTWAEAGQLLAGALRFDTASVVYADGLFILLSLLPQFITPQHDYVSRMTTLISIFAAVGLSVHLGYGFVAAIASHHLQNKKFLFWVNKVSAVLFWLLAIGVFWSLFTMPQSA